MPLNPRLTRSTTLPLDPTSGRTVPGFDPKTILSEFRTERDRLIHQVRDGNLTAKVARQELQEIRDRTQSRLQESLENAGANGQLLRDRLREVASKRSTSQKSASLEELQRETNRLLTLNLIEQQIRGRVEEFESRVAVKSMQGGPSAPTLLSLLEFHNQATTGNDEAAREWGRRQLETFRSQAVGDDDHRRIDLATRRPDRANPRLIDRYIQAIENLTHDERERFLDEALSEQETDACVAIYLAARDLEDPTRFLWVRTMTEALPSFPETAIETLRKIEDEASLTEDQSRKTILEELLEILRKEAEIPESVAPGPQEMERFQRIASRPVAEIGEPIGLALNRRGLYPSEQQIDSEETRSDSDRTDAP